MINYLLVGCEGQQKETEPKKGMCIFNINDGGKKDKPDIFFGIEEGGITVPVTPRAALNHDNSLYTITRTALFQHSLSKEKGALQTAKATFEFQKLKKKLGTNEEKERLDELIEGKKLYGRLAMQARVENGEPKVDLITSIYHEEGFLKQGAKGGFLLRFNNGTLNEDTVELFTNSPTFNNLQATGDIIEYNGAFYVASGGSLLVASQQRDGCRPYHFRGSVLATAALEEILAITNNYGDYKIITSGRETVSRELKDPENIFADDLILPSEATAVAITNYNRQKYVLFGLNYGQLGIYALDDKASPPLRFVGLLHFLTLEEIIGQKKGEHLERSNEDYHLRNMKIISNELYFTLRKNAYRYTLRDLFEAINAWGEDKHDVPAPRPRNSYELPHRATCLELIL